MWLSGLYLTVLLAAGVAGQQDPEWWQDGVIYQIYPRSFQDSNGDGVGDLKGIESRLDYLTDLGIAAIWLSPIYKSPMADFGYDISDFLEIDPLFGTMQDFDDLLAAARARGIGIMMDLVPNHSSDQHDWFIRSVAREDPYTDYYVWRPARGVNASGFPTPPNNWLSVFGGSAWTWSEERMEFYLHQFDFTQPDFNYENPVIMQEMKAILSFWLDKGVYGFRFDAVTHMFEDQQFLDEPLSNNGAPPEDYSSLEHVYTQNLVSTRLALAQMKAHIDQYEQQAGDGLNRLMMLEVWNPVDETMEYYRNVSDFPFNLQFLTNMNNASTAVDANFTVHLWLDNIPDGGWPNWVLGNHDISRVSTRLDLRDGALLTTLLLPGTSINYNGEELGMLDTPIPPEEMLDPAGHRDAYRTPMQWDDSTFAGFTTGEKPWLPVNENYVTLNAAAQEVASESVLKTFRTLVSLRHEPAVRTGELHTTVTNGDAVFAYARVDRTPGRLSYLSVFHWSRTQTVTVDLSPGATGGFPFLITEPEVILRTVDSDFPLTNLDPSSFELKPRVGFVASFSVA